MPPTPTTNDRASQPLVPDADDDRVSPPRDRPSGRIARAMLKAPIYFYRWTIRPWLGWRCRHLPTCSDYALEAIDRNGAWRGGWLTLSRLVRCQPFGTAGVDPVPDIRCEHHPLAPWRYGRWTGAHMPDDQKWDINAPPTRTAGGDDTAGRKARIPHVKQPPPARPPSGQ